MTISTKAPGARTGEGHQRELEPKRSTRRRFRRRLVEPVSHGSVSAAVDRRRYLGGMVTFLSVFGRGSSPVDVKAGPRAVR